MSGEALNPPGGPPLEGLTNARGLSLSRAPVRTRELAVTLSAWRLEVAGEEGAGSITVVEVPGSPAIFRGDGVCLGWSGERLAAAYEALVPRDDTSAAVLETPQLG